MCLIKLKSAKRLPTFPRVCLRVVEFGNQIKQKSNIDLYCLYLRSSQFATNGVAHIKTDWELKQEKRLKDQRTKELQKSMKEAKAEAQRVFISIH